MRNVFVSLLLVSIIGCGGASVTKNPEQVQVTFHVSSKGKPIDDVRLVLLAIDNQGGGQAEGVVSQGKVGLPVYPGKYTYFVEEGKSEAALAKIPVEFHRGALDRTIEVNGSTSIDLKLD